MNKEERDKKINDMLVTLEDQIMMCDDRDDLLVLASSMIVMAQNIYTSQLGVQGAKLLLQTVVNEMKCE